MDNTIIQQGRFTSTGALQYIPLRADVDWMKIYNQTVAANNNTTSAVGVEYYWQRGMAAGTGIEYRKSNAANASQLTTWMATGGFTTYNDYAAAAGTLLTTTAVSAAAIPVVTTTNPHGLSAGTIVRMINVTGALQLGGIDFTVGNNTLGGSTFSLDYMPQIVVGTGGFYRVIPGGLDNQWYPKHRTITKITQAASAVITMSVTHGFTVGQKVRLIVPAAYGMVEMNNLSATITAIDTTVTTGNSITVNIDSSAFTAFAFPVTLTGAGGLSQAMVVPVGEDTSAALVAGHDILEDSERNNMTMGMILSAGADSPAGSVSDVIYWVAGKSFSVTNT